MPRSKRGGARRNAGRPVTTGSASTQRIVYRVTAAQRAELEEEARRLGLSSADLAAKARAFPKLGEAKIPPAMKDAMDFLDPSPNGEYSCPCGHERVEAKREVKAVGTYVGSNLSMDGAAMRDIVRIDSGLVRWKGGELQKHTATLLANLERERVPGRRPIRTVRWYDGNGDE